MKLFTATALSCLALTSAAPMVNKDELQQFAQGFYSNWANESQQFRDAAVEKFAEIESQAEVIASNAKTNFSTKKQEINALLMSHAEDLGLSKENLRSKVDARQAQIADFIKDVKQQGRSRLDKVDLDNVWSWIETQVEESESDIKNLISEGKQYAKENGLTELDAQDVLEQAREFAESKGLNVDVAKEAARNQYDRISNLLDDYIN